MTTARVQCLKGLNALAGVSPGTSHPIRVSKLQMPIVMEQRGRVPSEILCRRCRPLANDLSVSRSC
jgi:hypothetical protein